MERQLSRDDLRRLVEGCGILPSAEVDRAFAEAPPNVSGPAIVQSFASSGLLTPFQAAALIEARPEDLVIGNYQVLDRLGKGGMGTVFKAMHRRMKRVVAIKVLSREVASSETFVQRFQREVEAAARLNHPNIVMAHDADEAEIGHFLVMEFVDGRDLAKEVELRGPLSIADAVDCALQAARALEYAHAKGVIHRDIKPANLIRDTSGVVKVADLGLARMNESLGMPVKEAAALTQAGTIMGTADFIAPEQAAGAVDLDHRVDIYSLGCTLYFLLTGKPPYEAPTIMALLMKHQVASIPSLAIARPETPPELDVIFQKMVTKDPAGRFASMTEVLRALEALGGRKPVPPPPAEPPSDQTIALTTAIQDTMRTDSVLLVEPSRSQAVIIRKYLEELGHKAVTVAGAGDKALELARTALPGVVISAMHLPDMTGVQLARKIHAEPRLAQCRFILITSQSDAQQANLEGATGIVLLTKPFDRDRLGQTLAAKHDPRAWKVLVVDDSAVARAHIRGVLAGLGLNQVVEAGDGGEAMTLLGKQTFDLVVTDYNMPRLDGRSLIAFIRQHSTRPAVPILLVTTETDPSKLDAVRQLGVTAILEKAFRPESVRAILEKLR